MPWYDGLTFEEVELAIREGRAPGSDVPGAWIEVPPGFVDLMNSHGKRLQAVSGTLIVNNRALEPLPVTDIDGQIRRLYDSIVVTERARIVEILRAKAREWNTHPIELVIVRGAVSRALEAIAKDIESTASGNRS